MKTKVSDRGRSLPFAFWDTSAIVPLCGLQRESAPARQATRQYRLVVWWGTSLEALSGFHRLRREGKLTSVEATRAIDRLDYLRARWDEVLPSEAVRETAERLLSRHRLRAADALQLAAALEWCGHRPRKRVIVAGDGDLLAAAEAEGFTCLRTATT